MKISIVTPSFNQAEYLKEAIESVQLQNDPVCEHIVLDNCSGDGTVDLLKQNVHLKWISEPDQGQSDALNKGFRMAEGDIIGWLNADDRYLAGAFQKVKDHFLRNPDCDIVYGDYRLIAEQGEVLQQRREIDFDLFLLKYLHVLTIPSTATFFRRRIFDDGNFLDISYQYAMDYEFFLRLASKGYRFAHLPEFLADFRWHANSKSATFTVKQRREQTRALFTHDPFLKSMYSPAAPVLRYVLMAAARSKRYALKGLRGYYMNQWVKR